MWQSKLLSSFAQWYCHLFICYKLAFNNCTHYLNWNLTLSKCVFHGQNRMYLYGNIMASLLFKYRFYKTCSTKPQISCTCPLETMNINAILSYYYSTCISCICSCCGTFLGILNGHVNTCWIHLIISEGYLLHCIRL